MNIPEHLRPKPKRTPEEEEVFDWCNVLPESFTCFYASLLLLLTYKYEIYDVRSGNEAEDARRAACAQPKQSLL